MAKGSIHLAYIKWTKGIFTSINAHLTHIGELTYLHFTSPYFTLMRLLLHYVAYNRGLFSKWHLLILSLIFVESPSIVSHPKISL